MTDVNKLKDWIQSQIADCELRKEQIKHFTMDNYHIKNLEAMKIALVLLNNACIWKYCDTEYCWDTCCGEKFQFMDGGPEDNNTRFCHSCGKPVVALYPEENV